MTSWVTGRHDRYGMIVMTNPSLRLMHTRPARSLARHPHCTQNVNPTGNPGPMFHGLGAVPQPGTGSSAHAGEQPIGGGISTGPPQAPNRITGGAMHGSENGEPKQSMLNPQAEDGGGSGQDGVFGRQTGGGSPKQPIPGNGTHCAFRVAVVVSAAAHDSENASKSDLPMAYPGLVYDRRVGNER